MADKLKMEDEIKQPTNVKLSKYTLELLDRVKKEDDNLFKSRQDVITYLVRRYLENQSK